MRRHPFIPAPFLFLCDEPHLGVAAFQPAKGRPVARWAHSAGWAGKASSSPFLPVSTFLS